jgi:hypothetical protein
MRLKGNLHCGGNPDQICNNFGIESFVNVTDPNIGDIWRYSSPQNSRECAVDHIFFTSEDCQGQGTQKKIMNMDDKFVLNEQHVVMYGLNMIKIEPS